MWQISGMYQLVLLQVEHRVEGGTALVTWHLLVLVRRLLSSLLVVVYLQMPAQLRLEPKRGLTVIADKIPRVRNAHVCPPGLSVQVTFITLVASIHFARVLRYQVCGKVTSMRGHLGTIVAHVGLEG